jgi:pimeloyl-ACP methyl ester carboxylesterase
LFLRKRQCCRLPSVVSRDRAIQLGGADMNTRDRLLAGLPVSDSRLELAGISTAVLGGGAGSPIVLLHGPGEFSAVWGRAIPELATSHRVIVPDLPGHGASGLPDGAWTSSVCSTG